MKGFVDDIEDLTEQNSDFLLISALMWPLRAYPDPAPHHPLASRTGAGRPQDDPESNSALLRPQQKSRNIAGRASLDSGGVWTRLACPAVKGGGRPHTHTSRTMVSLFDSRISVFDSLARETISASRTSN